MTSFPPSRRDRQLAAFGLTALVHALLVLAWQAARHVPSPQADVSWLAVQWIVPPAAVPAKPAAQPARTVSKPKPTPKPAAAAAFPPAAPETAPDIAPAAPADLTEPALPDAPDMSAKAILERARRDAGAVDRALRKESRPLLVLPRDSPQIRLRNGIEAAAEMAPNKWYQTPKMAELVNNTGDGARRTRVVGGTGTYCMTERSANTSVDTIEKHGKWRWTTCPKHEAPPKPQEWRTARDP